MPVATAAAPAARAASPITRRLDRSWAAISVTSVVGWGLRLDLLQEQLGLDGGVVAPVLLVGAQRPARRPR